MTDSTALVPVDNMAALDALGPASREAAVTHMLTEARDWLAHAKEATGPSEIATFKARMATLAEATKQLGLSKEIQLDAKEMVRRAERGVGLAIREGQERGEVVKRGDIGGNRAERVDAYDLPRPTDFASKDELMANGGGIYAMTDGVSDEQFDEAIHQAKAEGDLSRANVVRKVRSQPTSPGYQTRQQRAG